MGFNGTYTFKNSINQNKWCILKKKKTLAYLANHPVYLKHFAFSRCVRVCLAFSTNDEGRCGVFLFERSHANVKRNTNKLQTDNNKNIMFPPAEECWRDIFPLPHGHRVFRFRVVREARFGLMTTTTTMLGLFFLGLENICFFFLCFQICFIDIKITIAYQINRYLA